MSRRKARILAFQALYCYDAVDIPVESLLNFDWEAEKIVSLNSEVLAFARNLTAGTIENLDIIDEKIKEHLINWNFSRLKRVDLAVLRIGVYSLLFQKDIPSEVIIEEAIVISKEYGGDGSFKFVNGVLDNIKKTLKDAGSPEK
jgi:N utilization substance protein B